MKKTKSLNSFIYGSFVFLMIGLLFTAFVFSRNYLKKEQARAEISTGQLLNFFEFQYRTFSEEMWTKSYEAIDSGVKDITKELGNASYDLILTDPNLNCVYSSKAPGTCQAPAVLKQTVAASQFEILPKPVLKFDEKTAHYIYMIPLQVGTKRLGFLYTTISDPFQFYRGDTFLLILQISFFPILGLTIGWLLWLLISRRYILRPYLESLVQMEKKEALADLSAQVAHDIRSPLIALKTVLKMAGPTGDQERQALNVAASRIESIANDLITQFKGNQSSEKDFSFLVSAIESIVAEKRAIYGENSEIDVSFEAQPSLLGVIVPISETKLSRILSNLINNAVEAFKAPSQGKITIRVDVKSDRVFLSIEDNGKGIAPEILHRLRTTGGSYGKQNGSGMGLSNAKAILTDARGSVQIQSKVNEGTTLILEMPLSESPPWLAQNINLKNAARVVVLDDDESVHLLWKKRLSNSSRVTHIRDPEDFTIERFPKENCHYVFDYEILESPMTGLDLIIANGLGDHAILVTSHFNNPEIQLRVERSGAKMIPKFMIGQTDILWSPGEELETSIRESNLVSQTCDLVLIDDDDDIRNIWAMRAESKGKKLIAVDSLEKLELASLSYETPIFIDQKLGKVKGTDVARKLHQIGFKNLTIASGYSLERKDVPEFIRDVQGKGYPEFV